MKKFKYLLSVSTLFLGSSMLIAAKAGTFSFGPSDVMFDEYNTKSLHTKNDNILTESYIEISPLKEDDSTKSTIMVEDNSPMRIIHSKDHNVTKNISAEDVLFSAFLAQSAYSNFENSPLILEGYKVHSFGESYQGVRDGYVLEGPNSSVHVVYRGTVGLNLLNSDWLNNYNMSKNSSSFAKGLKDSNDNEVLFHSGFLHRAERSSKEVSNILNDIATRKSTGLNELDVTFNGHSKGGGIAVVAATLSKELFNVDKPKLITLAAPRALNVAGVNHFNDVVGSDNVVLANQTRDLVTAVAPGFLGFKHPSEDRLYLPLIKGQVHLAGAYREGLNLIDQARNQGVSITTVHGDVNSFELQKSRGNPIIRNIKALSTTVISTMKSVVSSCLNSVKGWFGY